MIWLFCRTAENFWTGLGACLSEHANDSGQKEIPGQQTDSVQVVYVVSRQAENFGKGISLSLIRGVGSSEGT